jgi:hypothetical protein
MKKYWIDFDVKLLPGVMKSYMYILTMNRKILLSGIKIYERRFYLLLFVKKCLDLKKSHFSVNIRKLLLF